MRMIQPSSPSSGMSPSRYARTSRWGLPVLAILAIGLASAAPSAVADAFASAHYDPATDSLVVTLLYRGTNPNHQFTLNWGTCSTSPKGRVNTIAAQVLDSQWQDAALHDYRMTVHFDLGAMPCRPAEVTLRTAPRFHITVHVPLREAKK